jgi:hypothetical protein
MAEKNQVVEMKNEITVSSLPIGWLNLNRPSYQKKIEKQVAKEIENKFDDYFKVYCDIPTFKARYGAFKEWLVSCFEIEEEGERD